MTQVTEAPSLGAGTEAAERPADLMELIDDYGSECGAADTSKTGNRVAIAETRAKIVAALASLPEATAPALPVQGASAALLPCPFCGGRATGPGNENAGLYWISCTTCEAEMSHGVPASLVKQWNRRAPESPQAPALSERALLQRWLDYATKAAGMTEAIVRDNARFKAFMDDLDHRKVGLVTDTRAALATPEARTPSHPVGAP